MNEPHLALQKLRLLEQEMIIVSQKKAALLAKRQELLHSRAQLDSDIKILQQKINKALLTREVVDLSRTVPPLGQQSYQVNTPFKKLTGEVVSVVPSLRQEYDQLLVQYDQVIQKASSISADIEEAKILSEQLKSNLKMLTERSTYLQGRLNKMGDYSPVKTDYTGMLRDLHQEKDLLLQELHSLQQHSATNKTILAFMLLSRLQVQSKFFLKNWGFSRLRAKDFSQAKAILNKRVFMGASLRCLIKLRHFFNRWSQATFRFSRQISKTQKLLQVQTTLSHKRRLLNLWKFQFEQRKHRAIDQICSQSALTLILRRAYRQDARKALLIWKQKSATRVLSSSLKRLGRIRLNYVKSTTLEYWNSIAVVIKKLIARQVLANEETRLVKLMHYFRRWKQSERDHADWAIKRLLQREENNLKVIRYFNFIKRRARFIMSVYLRLEKARKRHYFCRYFHRAAFIATQQLDKQSKAIRYEKRQSEKRSVQFQQESQLSLLDKLQSIVRRRDRFFTLRLFKRWEKTAIFLKGRTLAVASLLRLRINKEKIGALSKLSMNVRHDEKSKMHKVLSGINHDIQNMKQKSDNYREQLKQQISELGMQASKAIVFVIARVQSSHIRDFFSKCKKRYRKLLRRKFSIRAMVRFASDYVKRKAFQQVRDIYFIDKEEEYQDRLIDLNRKAESLVLVYKHWSMWYKAIKKTKPALRKLSVLQSRWQLLIYKQFWNNLPLYPVKCQKVRIEKELAKVMEEKEDADTRISNQQSQIQNLKEDNRKVQQRFISFQRLTVLNKRMRMLERRKGVAFRTWRQLSKRHRLLQMRLSILNNISLDLVYKSALAKLKANSAAKAKERQQQDQLSLRQKYASIREKQAKVLNDITKRLNNLQSLNQQLTSKSTKKSSRIAHFSQHQAQLFYKNLDLKLLSKSLRGWQAVNSACRATAQVLHKVTVNSIKPCFLQIANDFNQFKFDQVRVKRLQKCGSKKQWRCVEAMFFIWLTNAKRLKSLHLQQLTSEIQKSLMREKLVLKAWSARAVDLVNSTKVKQHLYASYIKFKKYAARRFHKHRKIRNSVAKIKERVKREVLNQLYVLVNNNKHNSRLLNAHLKSSDTKLLAKVFISLRKRFRSVESGLARLGTLLYSQIYFSIHTAFYNIRPIASKNDMIRTLRKQLLHHCLLRRLNRQSAFIAARYFYQWRQKLVDRSSSLVLRLHQLFQSRMSSNLSRINQHRFWNEDYVQRLSDLRMFTKRKVFKKEVDMLIQENFNPNQIKDHIKHSIQKDTNLIKKVFRYFKHADPAKLPLLKGWNSWREYVSWRKHLRACLDRLNHLLDKKGRAFLKWKRGDPDFRQLLKQSSRMDLITKYNAMSNMQKQLKSALRVGSQKLEQLVECNQDMERVEYISRNSALKIFAEAVKTSLQRGFKIWKRQANQGKNERYSMHFQTVGSNIQALRQQKMQLQRKVEQARLENIRIRETVVMGKEIGNMLEVLIRERDKLSINLADHKQTIKQLLSENVGLKSQLGQAKEEAVRLLQSLQ